MTDKQTTKNDAQSQSKRPDMIAYHVKPTGNDNAIWTPVGAAWLNKDGSSYTVQIDALPLSGRIHDSKEGGGRIVSGTTIELQPRKEENKS